MNETLTGRQVLALLAQDEPPEIEVMDSAGAWFSALLETWEVSELRDATTKFRIKPTPQRRLSVTLNSGEVVSWPEPVRAALKNGDDFYYVDSIGLVNCLTWYGDSCDLESLKFGNVHLTREAAQEHADALRKINTQGEQP